MADKWIRPHDAVEALARQHDLCGRYAEYEMCIRVAEETIMARLEAGLIETCASYFQFFGLSGWEQESRDEAVPPSFWRDWNAATPIMREADWIAGDFRYEHSPEWSSESVWGRVFNVRFANGSIPGAVVDPSPLPAASASGRGRPPAPWWPAFAEELAIWLHDNGLPSGAGTDGQSEMIDGIFDSLANAGKPVPTRTTVQPVVNSVLLRLRSAGK